MSGGGCDDETVENMAIRERRKTLYAVLWVNALMFAGGLIIALNSFWPGIIVGSIVTAVFLHTAYGVLRDAVRAWRHEPGLEGESGKN